MCLTLLLLLLQARHSITHTPPEQRPQLRGAQAEPPANQRQAHVQQDLPADGLSPTVAAAEALVCLPAALSHQRWLAGLSFVAGVVTPPASAWQ